MKWKIAAVFCLALWFVPFHRSLAAMGELSLVGSYSKTDYGNNTYSTTKRYTAEAGAYLTTTTEIELSYSYTDSFLNYDPVQTTSVNEQTLSLSIVQALVPPSWFFQPFVKAGAAQYNRKQSGTIAGIPTTPVSTKSPSGVLGGGVKIYLLRNFSLKVEGVTYLPDLKLSQASNNFSVQGGVSLNF